jgi:hypothetical protein
MATSRWLSPAAMSPSTRRHGAHFGSCLSARCSIRFASLGWPRSKSDSAAEVRYKANSRSPTPPSFLASFSTSYALSCCPNTCRCLAKTLVDLHCLGDLTTFAQQVAQSDIGIRRRHARPHRFLELFKRRIAIAINEELQSFDIRVFTRWPRRASQAPHDEHTDHDENCSGNDQIIVDGKVHDSLPDVCRRPTG